MAENKKTNTGDRRSTQDTATPKKIIHNEYSERKAPEPVCDTVPPPKPPSTEKK